MQRSYVELCEDTIKSLRKQHSSGESYTLEKEPSTKPQTRDLRSNAEFQPRELWNWQRFLVPNRSLCAIP